MKEYKELDQRERERERTFRSLENIPVWIRACIANAVSQS
jgi:hypothetical protein